MPGRTWRGGQPTCIAGFDLDADGVNELVSGWTNGKLEVRGDRQGEVIFRDNLADSVSAVLQADYRSDGREEVIACGYDGEVGATPTPAEYTRVLCSPRVSSLPTPLPGFTHWASRPSPPCAPARATHGRPRDGDALGILNAGHTGDVGRSVERSPQSSQHREHARQYTAPHKALRSLWGALGSVGA